MFLFSSQMATYIVPFKGLYFLLLSMRQRIELDPPHEESLVVLLVKDCWVYEVKVSCSKRAKKQKTLGYV